ncbi:hypothetical protein EV131_114163 [Rhizobium laguerreae]|uniref:DUF4347 domain-containing protein n=1 Tax=Rhizobium laguerreae TaxID=1076926 RepID=A0AAX2QEQ3_9HYPH|nr:hypothetical protein EV131_114163 [Rhizobium laguerreae]
MLPGEIKPGTNSTPWIRSDVVGRRRQRRRIDLPTMSERQYRLPVELHPVQGRVHSQPDRLRHDRCDCIPDLIGYARNATDEFPVVREALQSGAHSVRQAGGQILRSRRPRRWGQPSRSEHSRDKEIEGCVGSSSEGCITARTDLRIAAAEYLDAALAGDGDDLDGLSLLDRHMVFLDTWKYAVDDDPKNSQALSDAASSLTSAAAKALLTGSKDEIAKIIRDPVIIGAIAFGGAGNARGIIGESAVIGRSGTVGGGIDGAVAAGASLVGADGNLRTAAGWVKPQKGVFDVVVHGEANGFFVQTADGNWTKISTNNLSQYMKANGYAGEPVRLISCGTGACNATAAQKLANQIGAPVTAPSDTVWIHPNGTLTVGSEATVNSGAWNTFTPGVKP